MTTPEPKEIREAFTEYTSEWLDIRNEGDTDMRYLAGDPWPPEDRAAREDAGRPCISLDELSQYINQYNNSLRQNKRAIQVIPKGDGANDADATRRENMIRGIENDCNAQEAYITMAENGASRSEGYLLLRTEERDNISLDDEPDASMFDQRIVIKRVANTKTILLNPLYEKADASDVEDAFVSRRIRKSEFARKYPKAEKVSFTSGDMRQAKDWIGDKDLQIAEYWKVHKSYRTLILFDGGQTLGPMALWEDELDKKPESAKVLKERRVEIKTVMQYPTNGLEVLDELPWAGSRIPIVACFGKELWVDEGSGPKRKLLSMIRLARDPQMLFAYMCTQEAEEAGMSPKAAYMGYAGQFEKSKAAWELINKQPFSYIEVDQVTDGATGQVLPLPQRVQWTPNFQEYEVAKDSIRRSIQAAMGITPLPTAAQRDSEKSGVALEKISQQESIGSFHFTDNFDRALQNLGWQVNELISEIYDTQREVPIEKADGTYATLHTVGSTSHPIQDGAYDVQGIPHNEQTGEPQEHLHTGKGNFDVTISTGPSYQSQREQASEFVDHLIANWQQLGIPAPLAQKILALGIKLKDIGPIGDAIQELLDPPSDMSGFPPAAQAAISQLNAQLQQLQQENQALHMDRAAKVLEQQTKLQIEDKRGQQKTQEQAAKFITAMSEADKDRETKLAVAEITTKAQNEQQRDQILADLEAQFHQQAQEYALAVMQHKQAMQAQQQQAATQSMSQASDQAHQQTMAEQQAQRPESGQ